MPPTPSRYRETQGRSCLCKGNRSDHAAKARTRKHGRSGRAKQSHQATSRTTQWGTARKAKRNPRATIRVTCPFCKAAINSQVRTGRVDHRSACGHRFRVHNEQVVQMRHEHVCPRCGTKIVSAKASGRVRSQHRTPKGKACPQSEWVVRSWMTKKLRDAPAFVFGRHALPSHHFAPKMLRWQTLCPEPIKI